MEQGWDKKGEGDGYEELQKIMGGRKKGDQIWVTEKVMEDGIKGKMRWGIKRKRASNEKEAGNG